MLNFKSLGAGVAGLVLVSGSAFAAAGTASAEGSCLDGVYAQVICTFSKGETEWTVPKGVDFVVVDMYGASGGNGTSKDRGGIVPGGKGGHLEASLAVTPGEKLQVKVGGAGYIRGGFNGGAAGYNVWAGGGGGASDIRTGAFTTQDRVLVVGGGGGGGSYNASQEGGAGGPGGGAADGGNGFGPEGDGGCGNIPGHLAGCGGRADAGGENGQRRDSAGFFDKYHDVKPSVPYMGSFGEGGDGAWNFGLRTEGGSGGGGGGWYGGGGGSYTAGGGGGSGHVGASAHVGKSELGVRSGDGEVKITYWKTQ